MFSKQAVSGAQIRPRLRILFCSVRFPYPLIGGDRVKPYHLLRHLASYHDVTLLTFHHGSEAPPEKVQAMEELGIDVVSIPLHPLRSGIKCLSNIANDLPLEIQFYQDAAYRKKVLQLLKEKNIDVAMGFFMRAGEYLRDVNVPKILIAEDCRTLYMQRSHESTSSASVHQKLIRRWELSKLSAYEPAMVRAFDYTTFVTQEDISAMRATEPNVQYRLLTNGVESDPASEYVNQGDRKDIVFAGKLDVWANTMMVHEIAKEIFPRIQDVVPDVKLHIVGGYPPKSILRLRSQNIHVHSNVSDVRKYLRSAAVFLHPHKGGSGIQNKALEAMASGCAVVTTTTGVHGIPALHGREVMIGKSSEEMAFYATQLLKDVAMRSSIAEKAQRLVLEKFSWETIFAQMDGILDEMFPPKPIRTDDFESTPSAFTEVAPAKAQTSNPRL
ncbi:MAG: glycosyltransferase [Candidatus Kapaibacterium sp.]|jgi:glycosyltransferase involved in cell wall biosynthesis